MDERITIITKRGQVDLSKGQINLIHSDFATGKTKLLEQEIAATALRSFELADSLQQTNSYDPTLFPSSALRLPPVFLLSRRGKIASASVLTFFDLAAELVRALSSRLRFNCSSCGLESDYYSDSACVHSAIVSTFDSMLICINAVVAHDRLNDALAQGFSRILVNSELVEIDSDQLKLLDQATLEVCIDRIRVAPDNQARLQQTLETALDLGLGRAVVRPLNALEHGFFIGHEVACRKCGLLGSILDSLSDRKGNTSSGWSVGAISLESLIGTALDKLGVSEILQNTALSSVIEILVRVGLSHLALNSSVRSLGPEERQRLRLAQLLNAPPNSSLILLPDLFNNSPEQNDRELFEALKSLLKFENTIVVSGSDDRLIKIDLAMTSIELEQRATMSDQNEPSPQCANLSVVGCDNLGLANQLFNKLRNHSSKLSSTTKVEVISDSAPESNRRVADLLGCSEQLAIFFAALEDARVEGFSARTFQQQGRDARFQCKACGGHGFFKQATLPIGQYIPRRCDYCNGSGVEVKANTVFFKGLSFGEILSLPLQILINDFSTVFRRSRVLMTVCALGLGKLEAHQPMWCLRPSERTAVILASALARNSDYARKWICSDVSSHLAKDSLSRAFIALRSILPSRDHLFIIANDARLDSLIDSVKTACSLDQLSATIMS